MPTSCLLCLQCKWFWKLAALCVCLWPEFSSFLFIWHFKYFYLELSHEFLLRKILLGEELKDKNRDPSGLQTERLERSGKAFGKAGNLYRGASKCCENWQNCEKRFFVWFPLLSDFTMTKANCWRPEFPLLLFVVKFEKNDAKTSGGRAAFGDDRLIRWEPPIQKAAGAACGVSCQVDIQITPPKPLMWFCSFIKIWPRDGALLM